MIFYIACPNMQDMPLQSPPSLALLIPTVTSLLNWDVAGLRKAKFMCLTMWQSQHVFLQTLTELWLSTFLLNQQSSRAVQTG